MYHYQSPPPIYYRYHYNTSASSSPSTSPPPTGPYNYYSPQFSSPTTSPKGAKRHSRKASYGSPPGPGVWYSPAGYPSPNFYATRPNYASPPGRHEDVSYSNHIKTKSRRFTTSENRGGGNTNGPRRHASVQSQKQNITVDTSDEAEDPHFAYIRPRPSQRREKCAKPKANDFFYNHQVPKHAEGYESQKSHSRRPSQSRPSTAKPAKEVPQAREATAADAAKYGIPAGFSLKNWDPTESPVILLGSVFDANSLGKWIYDWTVFHRGAETPLSEVAGDLWLLLIKLSSKMKRADVCLPRVRSPDNQELLEDFLESGDRLWTRFKKLLKVCQEYMYIVAEKEGKKGQMKMGKNAGCEFVDSIFGRDRQLEETESLMQSIRLWNMRFDANCDDILRRPSAA